VLSRSTENKKGDRGGVDLKSPYHWRSLGGVNYEPGLTARENVEGSRLAVITALKESLEHLLSARITKTRLGGEKTIVFDDGRLERSHGKKEASVRDRSYHRWAEAVFDGARTNLRA